MKQILLFLAGRVAPFVTLFYRKGIWLTPDDPVSPFGKGIPFMEKLYARFGKFIGDWWWLGHRNTAYGLAYKWKPESLKGLTTYSGLTFFEKNTRFTRTITARVPTLGGYEEYSEIMVRLGFAHLLWGYRIRPIRDIARDGLAPKLMDGRPILSLRGGKEDN